MRSALTLRWKLFLVLAFAAGLALRLIHSESMEWKEDEYYNFYLTQLIGHNRPWPWVGMNSGVYVPNPGLSIWVFAILAKLIGATDPVVLARGVAMVALLGITLILPFAFRFVSQEQREPWLWAYALAMVNPFAILYQRKLWPQPFLPLFCMLVWMGWWKRDRLWGALLWGFAGALLGQIHMAGFFLAFAVFLWTLAFSRGRARTHWLGWLAGSALGALPLIPWLVYWVSHPTGQPIATDRWGEIVQFKFWVFWITDPLGLHLGNPLGLHRGSSLWAQISDFVRYPYIAGHPSYLCGAAHAVILVIGLWAMGRGIYLLRRKRKLDETGLVQSAALWGFGPLLTATGINIRRYYLVPSFPLEFVWLARLISRAAGRSERTARRALFAIWVAQLIISGCFVHYVHHNRGSLQGDYGEAYELQREKHHAATGETWPDLKLVH